ncbi:RNA-directed DNA polymerase, eukaryota, reverse transcriptase zinc-binding domain protein [Tanacetum coccineum]
MRESHYDYGPVLFRFFHYWFDMEGFDKLVKDSWKEAPMEDTNALIKIMKKLKYLKEKIRVWNKTNKECFRNSMRNLKADLAELDLVIDKGEGDDDVVNKRKLPLDRSEIWRSFHCQRRLKRRRLNGLLREMRTLSGNSSFIALIPKTPDANMVKDFRPISLIGSLYKIIAKILANRLMVILGNLVNEVQSAFVVDRKILDGPFILNKIFQWCKSKKKQSLVLRGLVIVNGSPTEEFQFYKGLKQGDPLSPFLFILVMESLHVSFQRVVDAYDAIFVGQYNESNINTIVDIMDCFHRASGNHINMSKSKLLGISVDVDKVDQAARKLVVSLLKPHLLI